MKPKKRWECQVCLVQPAYHLILNFEFFPVLKKKHRLCFFHTGYLRKEENQVTWRLICWIKNNSYSRNSFQQQLLKQLLEVKILSSTLTRLSRCADQEDCKNKPQKHKSRPALFYLFKSVSSVSPSPLWCIEMNEQALTQQVCLNVCGVTSPLKQIFWHVTVGKASV